MPELFQVITATQANERLAQHLTLLQRVEHVSLAEALDRVTAAELLSPTNLPTFPRSTMDGFAVRAADTYGASEGLPAYLNLCGEVPMGRAADVQVRLGEAARVHTGGMIPPGSDAVVMIENTQALDEQMIEVVRPVAMGENVLPVGDDVRQGDVLFPRGHWLRPQDLGGLAGVGLTSIPVVARPRVAILATGDEVVSADREPAAGQIRDINTHSVSALIRRAGGEPLPLGIAPDDAETMRQMACDALADADMLIISAGSSVSTRDMTAQMIAELGAPGVLVHGVSIRPGKPSILALADGKPVFGLPGNPVSTMIVYQLFVTPALHQLLGCTNPPARPLVQARLAQNVASRSGSEDFVPVYLEQRDDGLWAIPIFGKSNLIYTMVRADGLLQVPLDQAGLYAEDMVTIRLF
ncbi:MAG: molybdopterin molybdotransferase MoeA [Chloroflexi bacterium AL-W]|nr:molybdopterin molybdotransferase MoeA [Chloroflexi bacterium AL-N1]NOK69560.1 molybdopterin molybdotransferase MoeA [Chloroflexi bacterium AL-N10]NOK77525.1 molybdopterin molybdotransferase MoeA [Chloroflexi bacterium AL-N5]NOK84376.1 molybdopterin molybdotransferase MoeA [Chloroflexi bacterium AL-W]NOK91458.1 molybdopterin molybdotransferase MoeA [Chloroflexi bacterium AL-N15]